MNPKFLYFLLTVLVTMYSCKPFLINSSLERMGIFDDEVILNKLEKNTNEIVFIPMHHAGTELFYEDVKQKIDSLKNQGFYFYWELTKSNKMDSLKKDTLARKLRKITGIHYFKNDFNGVLDSLLNGKIKKLKKQLINQPSYVTFGIDSINGRNVDATMSQMLDFFDKKYGAINLEPCDFETKLSEKSNCQKIDNISEIRDDVIINFRNTIVLEELDAETKNKIAIIYGRAHFEGIKQGLLERGYTQVSPLPE